MSQVRDLNAIMLTLKRDKACFAQANSAPDNTFTLLDYAYGDLGERVRVGQKRSKRQAAADTIPHEGSLGFLALGAAGLMAWRQRRSEPLS